MLRQQRFFEFGDFRVDVAACRLYRRDGESVRLTPRVFDTLLYLIEHRDRLLDKDELMAAIWPGRVVEENNLNQAISALRRALGDRDGEQILTVPGRGYRFVAVGLPLADVAAQPAHSVLATTDERRANVVRLRIVGHGEDRRTSLPRPAAKPLPRFQASRCSRSSRWSTTSATMCCCWA